MSYPIIASCKLCDFKVPYDSIGVPLMQTHLEEEHDIRRTLKGPKRLVFTRGYGTSKGK